MEQEKITLSLLDVEKKYTYDINETTYGDGIVQWGSDNMAPVLYRNCYRNSATLKSIIDGSVGYVLGDGIEVNVEKWKESVNRRGMTMRQFVAALASSWYIYGGFSFQVIYNRLGAIVELFALDFSKLRTNESLTKVWYSKKGWTKWSSKAEVFDTFNPDKYNPENPTQIFYYKGDFSTNVYPMPPYYAAITDILTEIECGKYGLNSVSNGFSARYIFQMPEANNLTDEQKRDINEAIKTKFTGSEPECNYMIYWGDNGRQITVTKIEGDDEPTRYVEIKNNARANIFVSLRATPNLFGLPDATSGFNSQEYSAAIKLYEKTVIDPLRDQIKEAIDRVAGMKDAITITPIAISFDNE